MGFVPTAAALHAAFRRFDADGGTRNRVRALVLCFPNNPTGARAVWIVTLRASDHVNWAGELNQILSSIGRT
jgi:hypothetical protein